MKENILTGKKNGMVVLLLTIVLLLAATAGCILAGFVIDAGNSVVGGVLLAVSLIVLTVGWIPFLGLKILKPQEALVLTLFGKYVGTLKNEGFYFVNPFCVAVNPAATTS